MIRNILNWFERLLICIFLVFITVMPTVLMYMYVSPFLWVGGSSWSHEFCATLWVLCFIIFYIGTMVTADTWIQYKRPKKVKV